MKKNLFILIFFFLIGCTSNKAVNTDVAIKTSCPIVLFSSEHNQYIAANSLPITLANISYRAELNNYTFNSDCTIKDKVIKVELSLLFIVKPDLIEESSIILPFYVTILNRNNEIVDMQYYKVEGDFDSESKSGDYIETELVKTIRLQLPYFNDEENSQNNLVVGFMLDKKKLEVLY